MATLTTVEPARVPVDLQQKKAVSIKYWAAAGAVFLAFGVYVMGSWLLSGDLERTPAGPTPVPYYMKLSLTAFMIFGWVCTPIFLYLYVVKPWRRDGRISSDGLLMLAFMGMVWQDPLSDWLGPGFTYNTWLLNWGSWLNHVPGVIYPQGHRLAEPPLITGPLYCWAAFGFVLVGCFVMRQVQARRPNISRAGLVAWCFVAIAAADIFWEIVMMVGGYWSYTAVIPELTLFPDRYYRFPLYEAILLPVTWTAYTCLRFFKNDKGQMLCERGVERLRLGTKGQTAVRFLATYAAANALLLFAYNLPYGVFIANSEGPPKDIAERSYFMNGICGEGDPSHACWGPSTPIPRPGSARIDADGNLVPAQKPLERVPFKR